MCNLDMQMYKDGNRTILVLNNCDEHLNGVISKIVAEAGGTMQTIENVVPLNIPVPEQPQISGETENKFTDIDERKLLKEEGFRGFAKAFQFYKEHQHNLSKERNKELNDFFRMYAATLRNTPANSYTDGQLKDFLNVGLNTVFSAKLPQLLQTCGLITLEELLNGGRPVLEYCYNICVGVCAA